MASNHSDNTNVDTCVAKDGMGSKENGVVQADIEAEDMVVIDDKAPDGGWGWFVLFGRVLSAVITGGMTRSDGILYVKFMERYKESATATAWACSANQSVRMLVGPIASILCNRFSCRTLSSFGAILIFAGILSTAFAPNLPFLYLSYGFLNGINIQPKQSVLTDSLINLDLMPLSMSKVVSWLVVSLVRTGKLHQTFGVGRAFVLTPSTILMGYYFDKKRSLAFGIATAGFTIGGATITPLTEVLFQTYAFSGTFIILSGITLNYFVSAALFRSIEVQRKIMAQDQRRRHLLQDKQPEHKVVEKDILLEHQGNENGSNCLSQPNKNIKADAIEMTSLKTNGTVVIETSHADDKLIADVKDGCVTHTDVVDDDDDGDDRDDKDSNETQNYFSNCCRKFIAVLSELKDARFIAFAMASFCFALHNGLLFYPPLFKSSGLTEYETASILSASAICDTVARVASGFIFDLKILRNSRTISYNIFAFVESLVTLSFPFVTSYSGFLTLSAGIGVISGAKVSQNIVVLLDILGVDNMANALALQMIVVFLAKAVGPTVSGLLIDMSGSYGTAFSFGGSAILTGSFILLAGNIRKYYIDRAQSESGSQESTTSSNFV